MSHLRREEEHYEKIADSIQELDKEREEESKGSVNVRILVQGYYYSRLLDRKKSEQKKSVERAEKVVEVRRNELSEATRRRKVLEKLREKKVEEYNTDVIREEQALIDDSATIRFNETHRKK